MHNDQPVSHEPKNRYINIVQYVPLFFVLSKMESKKVLLCKIVVLKHFIELCLFIPHQGHFVGHSVARVPEF